MSDWFEDIRREIRIIMNDITDTVITNGCTSFDDYKMQVGRVEGLAMAERIVLDMRKKVLQDDDGD
jgi:hypothetical protein